MVANVEAMTVGKTLCNEQAEALVDTVPNTISELLAKKIADTLFCVKTKAPVRTEIPTFVPVRPYTVVDTLNEVKSEALVYTQGC